MQQRWPMLLEGADKQDRADGEINKIAQMEKTPDPRVALVSRLDEIDIVRIVVWLKKHRHSPPCGAPQSRRHAKRPPVYFPLTFVG
jgi:hypothetical protein